MGELKEWEYRYHINKNKNELFWLGLPCVCL